MNVKHSVIAAAAILACATSFADDIYPYVDHSRFVGAKSRAEVQAELAAAGPVTSRLHEFVDHTGIAYGKTRTEIRAELDRAYTDGSLASRRMSEFADFNRPIGAGNAAAALAELGQDRQLLR